MCWTMVLHSAESGTESGTRVRRSVEDHMNEAVKGMYPAGRLEVAIRVIEQGLESEEC